MPATKVQRMMRHRELSTTLRHYHKLELSSIAEGLSVLPVVARADVLAATGTDCESGSSSGSSRREKRLETAKHGATASTHEATCATPETPTAREVTRSDETKRANLLSFPIPRALSSVG